MIDIVIYRIFIGVTESAAPFFALLSGRYRDHVHITTGRKELMVTVNGKELDVAGKNLAEFLDESNYKPVRVVVEINEEIIPREQYGNIFFSDNDCVEVVSFMGGGAAK